MQRRAAQKEKALLAPSSFKNWIPASAGMTRKPPHPNLSPYGEKGQSVRNKEGADSAFCIKNWVPASAGTTTLRHVVH
ncbi:MAG: hypothetical protein ACRECH_17755, partial [Nitrososphaerales archaeon]